jgi:hypothetical protein
LAVCSLAVCLGAAYMLAQSPTLAVPPVDVFAQGGSGGPGEQGPGMPPPPGGHGDMGNTIQMIGHMGEAMFNPRIAGVIAVSGLKDQVGKKLPEKIKFFEAQLEKTKSLGLRNTIRMVLKEFYQTNGDDDKAVDQLKSMLEENDAAIQQEKPAK